MWMKSVYLKVSLGLWDSVTNIEAYLSRNIISREVLETDSDNDQRSTATSDATSKRLIICIERFDSNYFMRLKMEEMSSYETWMRSTCTIFSSKICQDWLRKPRTQVRVLTRKFLWNQLLRRNTFCLNQKQQKRRDGNTRRSCTGVGYCQTSRGKEQVRWKMSSWSYIS